MNSSGPSVVHVNRRDLHGGGGADRAGARVHLGLRDLGVESTYLSLSPTGRMPASFSITPSRLERGTARLRSWVAYRDIRPHLPTATPFQHPWGGSPLARRRIEALRADVIHLHWIAAGVLPIRAIPALRGPLVMTIHDEWPYTGGCHYRLGCSADATGCGACPQLGSEDPDDVSRRIWAEKRRAFARVPGLVVISPSSALATAAASSPILGHLRVVTIPNPVDVDHWSPAPDRAAIRARLDIPTDRVTVLFAAGGQTRDPIKGFDLLTAALERMEPRPLLIVAGGGDRPIRDHGTAEFRRNVGTLGDVELRDLMRAVDALVVPSRSDNLPSVAIEAQASGTPVVAFRQGGLPDIVEHRATGWLAAPFESADLAAGIAWVADPARRPEVGVASRARAVARFAPKSVADRHIELYREVLAASGRSGGA